MTARKIPAKENSIRGVMPNGQAFESTLERDFYILLEFDPTVAEFYAQAVAVPYADPSGKARTYYPDTLIHFRPDITTGSIRPSLLAEVKPDSQYRHPSNKLLSQMHAAQTFAAKRGWDYQVFTENDIRTPRLQNATFLRQYYRRVPTPPFRELILTTLSELGKADAETLLAAIYKDKWNQATLIPYLWHLVAMRDIKTNLDSTLTMNSQLWIDDRFQ